MDTTIGKAHGKLDDSQGVGNKQGLGNDRIFKYSIFIYGLEGSHGTTQGLGQFSVETDGVTGYYKLDELGSNSKIYDTLGNTKASFGYDEFGNIANPEGVDTFGNIFAYTGHVYDTSTGVYYAKARYYDASIGRFLSEDIYRGSIKNPITLHLYTYGNNNPIRNVDPSGYIPVETVADFVSIGWSLLDLVKNPSLTNAGFLIWDIAATVIPYVPGSYIGKSTEIVGKLDDVSDVARAFTKVNNITDATKGFYKHKESVIRVIKNLKKW